MWPRISPPQFDKEAFASDLAWYLRHAPEALDQNQFMQAGKIQPRGRDLWAFILADLKGVPFSVPEVESHQERDRRIEDLLGAIECGTSGKAQDL